MTVASGHLSQWPNAVLSFAKQTLEKLRIVAKAFDLLQGLFQGEGQGKHPP